MSGAVVDIGLLYIFVEYFHINSVLAASFSFLFAVVNNFFWNKYWTFGSNIVKYKRQFIKFLTVSLVGLGLTMVLMYLGVEVFNFWYLFVKVVTILFVLIWNFAMNYLWTFEMKQVDKNSKNVML